MSNLPDKPNKVFHLVTKMLLFLACDLSKA